MIHLKNDYIFWFILETQTEFNYGHRNYIEPISKDHMKILWDCYNLIIKESRIGFFGEILQKKYQRALNRNELI